MGTPSETESNQPNDWMRRYELHIAHIDEQHSELAALIDSLKHAALAGQNDAVHRRLTELLILMERHFSDEEEFMKAHEYPGFRGHARVHGEFLQEAADLATAVRSGICLIDTGFCDRIRQRLEDHVDFADRKYAAYCLGVATRLSPSVQSLSES